MDSCMWSNMARSWTVRSKIGRGRTKGERQDVRRWDIAARAQRRATRRPAFKDCKHVWCPPEVEVPLNLLPWCCLVRVTRLPS